MHDKETGVIKFVRGTDQYGAKPLPELPNRFAVLTWIDCGGDSATPWLLFEKCIPQIAEIVRAEKVAAEFFSTGKRFLQRPKRIKSSECPWLELTSRNKDKFHGDVEFPDKIRFEHPAKIILLAETEWWSLVGGPQPYHDSTTISFFTDKDLSDVFQNIFKDAAMGLGLEIK